MEVDRPKNFTLVLYETGSGYKKRIDRWETKSIRRFRTRLKLLKNLKPSCEAYLRVHYTSGGHNDGFYDNWTDLMFAFEAFVEK